MKLKLLGILGGVLASTLLSAGAARADSIELSLEGGAPTVSGSDYIWKYDVDLTPGNSVAKIADGLDSSTNAVGGSTGSVLNFDGLGGVVSVLVSNSNWTLSHPSSPPTIEDSSAETTTGTLAGTDDLFTYNGGFMSNPGTTDLVLATITIISTIGPSSNTVQYQSRDVNGTSSASGYTTGGFYSSIAGPAAVPLPAAAWTGMTSLLAVAGFSLLRRRRLV